MDNAGMKKIAEALWNEPVLAAGVLNTVLVVLSTEGIISGWIAAAVVAVSGLIVRRFTIPENKLTRALDRGDSYGGTD
jgi:hypothetical protein